MNGLILWEAYRLLVYNINYVRSNQKISDIIHLDWKSDINPTADIVYDGSYRTENITFNDAIHKPDQNKIINVIIDGKISGIPVITDSLLIYNLNFKAIAAYTDSNKTIEFYIKKKNIATLKKIKLSISFIKKNKALYLLVLSGADISAEQFDEKLLQKIITQK